MLVEYNKYNLLNLNILAFSKPESIDHTNAHTSTHKHAVMFSYLQKTDTACSRTCMQVCLRKCRQFHFIKENNVNRFTSDMVFLSYKRLNIQQSQIQGRKKVIAYL